MIQKAMLRLIRIYQRRVSPLLPKSCIYVPSCSEYMYQALTKYGAAKGLYLGIKRIFRCHPWGRGGYDPVK